MKYEDIIPTHNSLRNVGSFEALVNNPSLILGAKEGPLLLQTEDGKLYLNDGHHRLTAAHLLDIPLEEIKLRFVSYTYQDLLTPNFDIGWLTPYDPRVNVRRNDCLTFKLTLIDYLKECNYSADSKSMAIWMMSHFPQMYIEERKINSLKELVPNGTYSL